MPKQMLGLRKKSKKNSCRRLSKASGSALDHIGNTIKHKPVGCWVVYFISPKTGKPIVMQGYEDQSKAKEHLAEFKKRYGKYVQAGVQETVGDKTKDIAVQKFSAAANSSKMKPSLSKCLAIIRQRKEWSR